MTLDLFQREAAEDEAFARRNQRGDLPATFDDTFSAAWTHGALFGQSIARQNARVDAMWDYIADVKARTGHTLPNPALDLAGSGGLDEFNAEVAKLAERFPNAGLKPLTPEDLDQLAVDRAKKSNIDFATTLQRERTGGGSLGLGLGELASALDDPINLLAFPLAAPASLGIVKTTLAWAAIAGGTQTAIELAGLPFRERVDPDYATSGQPFRNVIGAAVGGGAIGGGLKALGAGWARMKNAEWPRSIRDAGNVIESEAQIAGTNVLPGVEGEAAHHAALSKAIDDVVAGKPVEVDGIVRPDLAPALDGAAEPSRAFSAAARAGEAERAQIAPASAAEASRGNPPPPSLSELAAEISPARVAEVREDPLTAAAVSQEIDRLRANKDLEIPVAETVDKRGNRTAVMRSLDQMLSDAETRERAAAEIRLCATPGAPS